MNHALSEPLRVAAAQFASTSDLDQNLATCLRMLDAAAKTRAQLIVFGEFANHISVYRDAEHCRSVAVELDGPWLAAIAHRVAGHGVHLVVTPTVARPDGRVTVTNVMIGPTGSVLATADKNTLMGNERAYLSGGKGANPPAETDFGPVGMYSCMDGVTFEVPRGLAVSGARLLTNSLNSFALDEAALHIPVRAVENGVWVVAANKVGPLLPPDQVEQFSAALGVPAEALHGAGESQIVAPDGRVVAKAPRHGEAVIVADIDLAAATRAPIEHRRPQAYAALARPETATPRGDIAATATAVAVADPAGWDQALAASPDLVVLAPGVRVPTEIPAGTHVVASDGSVTTAAGVVLRQAELHAGTGSDRGVELVATPFGDLAVVVGEDWRYPETFRLAAIKGAHVVAVCWRPETTADRDLAIVERAAENRLCLVAAAPLGQLGTMVLNPPADSLWNPARARAYGGTINTPEQVRAEAGDQLLIAELYPRRAIDREISRDTDLVAGRSWQASSVLVDQTRGRG